MTTILQIPSFSLTITPLSSHISFAAEHQPSRKIFTITIDKDSIAQTTNNLFDNTETLIQGLKEAANKTYPGLSLNIDPEGKLTYNVIFSVGALKKEFSFTLDLEEVIQQNPIETTENNSNLENNESLKSHGQQFEKLESLIIQIEQRLALLEKFARRDKEGSKLFGGPFFKSNSTNAAKYAISPDGKTAVLIDGCYPCLELALKIPSYGQHSYSLKINQESQEIFFGITKKVGEETLSDEDSYRYSTKTGEIHGKVLSVSGPSGRYWIFGGRGRVLKMTASMSMDLGVLAFFVDDHRVESCEITKSDEYVAFVSLGGIGDSVTFI